MKTMYTLQDWQYACQPLDSALSQALLVLDHESDLVQSIYNLLEAHDRLVADAIGYDDYDTISDFRIGHLFGAHPMHIFVDGEKQVIDSVEKLAEWIERRKK